MNERCQRELFNSINTIRFHLKPSSYLAVPSNLNPRRINYTPTQPILVYSLVSIYLSFYQLYTDAAYTSLLASFHLLVILSIIHRRSLYQFTRQFPFTCHFINYTPTQPILVYSLVSIYLSFYQLYTDAAYTSLLASFHLLVILSIIHRRSLYQFTRQFPFTCHFINYTPTQPILVYSLVSIYLSFYQLYTDAAYTSLLHLLVILSIIHRRSLYQFTRQFPFTCHFINYTPTQPILVYSLVSIYLSFYQLYTDAAYTSLLASFHLLVILSIIHRRSLYQFTRQFPFTCHFINYTPTQPILVYSLVSIYLSFYQLYTDAAYTSLLASFHLLVILSIIHRRSLYQFTRQFPFTCHFINYTPTQPILVYSLVSIYLSFYQLYTDAAYTSLLASFHLLVILSIIHRRSLYQFTRQFPFTCHFINYTPTQPILVYSLVSIYLSFYQLYTDAAYTSLLASFHLLVILSIIHRRSLYQFTRQFPFTCHFINYTPTQPILVYSLVSIYLSFYQLYTDAAYTSLLASFHLLVILSIIHRRSLYQFTRQFPFTCHFINYTPTQPILVYSLVSIYLSFYQLYTDAAYTSLLASFHLLVILSIIHRRSLYQFTRQFPFTCHFINYTPTQPILVYSLVSIYLSFYQLYTDAAYTSLLASFHLLVILSIIHRRSLYQFTRQFPFTCHFINYTPTQPILVYSLVSIYLSFYQLYTDAAYTSLLASFHLLVILSIIHRRSLYQFTRQFPFTCHLINYTPTQPIQFTRQFHLLVILSIIHRRSLYQFTRQFPFTCHFINYTPTQPILVYSLVSIYLSFYQLYTDAAYTSLLASFHLLVILSIIHRRSLYQFTRQFPFTCHFINYTPTQPILVYSLVSIYLSFYQLYTDAIYLSFDQLYTDAAYTSLLASFHLLVI